MEYGTGQLLLGMGGGASLSIDDGGRLTSNGSIIGKGTTRRKRHGRHARPPDCLGRAGRRQSL